MAHSHTCVPLEPAFDFDLTKIVSRESVERIRELAIAVERDCYVTNTLKRACRVTGKVFLNGELVSRARVTEGGRQQ